MKNENFFTVPNLLSGYRLLSFPFVLYLAISGQERLFALFLIINLITDVLDGLIARVFNLQTEFGARLDSIADIGMYICAVTGVYIFKAVDFAPHLISLLTFIGFFFAPHIISLNKFGRLHSMHLYLSKIGGYIQGAFFFVLFAFGFYTAFYYFTIVWGIMAFSENIIIQCMSSTAKTNSKGLYWILKGEKSKV